ncbi:MAG: nicotinate (nicotinamide) nucleotide adenylyltransferase [Bacteroidota bacterium]
MPKHTGLFFGSFNPIHQGHLILAEFFASLPEMEEVWLVLSPQNPFKSDENMLDFDTRAAWIEACIQDNPRLKLCAVEKNFSLPSYTHRTLEYLHAQEPERSFVLLLGEDQLLHFTRWKNFDLILDSWPLWVYPRHFDGQFPENPVPHRLVNAPKIEISSTLIRNRLAQGLSVRYLVPDILWKTCANHPFWRG